MVDSQSTHETLGRLAYTISKFKYILVITMLPQSSPTQPFVQRRTSSSIRRVFHQIPSAIQSRAITMQQSIHNRVNTATQIVKQRPIVLVTVLLVIILSVSVIYYTLFYTPLYTPRIVGDINFDPPVCIDYVNNITKTYNDNNNIVSMYDIHHGLHNTNGLKLHHTQSSHEALDYYIVGDDNSMERQRWNQRQNIFHLLWEDPVRKCPCHTCMHKLKVLVRSFLATQNLNNSSIILWASNTQELYDSIVLAPILPWVMVRKYDPFELAAGTFLEGNPILSTADSRVYLQGDLFRWLVLYVYGGVYIDADSILLNDFAPLLEKGDFWARWACTDDLTPGIMSLSKHGKVAYEVLHQLINTDPSEGGYIWGRGTMTPWYNNKLAKQKAGTLTADEAQIPYTAPACFFFPQWCTEQFHDYFDSTSASVSNPPELFLGGFAYHWHGGGGKRFERSYSMNSQFDLTERYVNKLLQLKFGRKTHQSHELIENSINQAKTSTGLVRHSSVFEPTWDTEHWYTTAFNQYAPPNACTTGNIHIEHILIFSAVAIILFCIVTQVFVKGGSKAAIRTTYNTTVQLIKSIYHIVLRLIDDVIGNIIYNIVQMIVRRVDGTHRYHALPPQSTQQNTRTSLMQRLTDSQYKTSTQRILLICLISIIYIIVRLVINSFESHDCGFGAGGTYSIGMYVGTSVLNVNQQDASKYKINNPVLVSTSVYDRPAKFVADPFIIHPSGELGDKPWWYLFFEVQSQPTGTEDGDIGVAMSMNGITWHYSGIVLDESFHLSYPYVFQYDNVWYMIPETGQRQQIRLYQATDFPYGWVLSSVLLDEHRSYLDTSIFQYHGYWYMYFTIGGDNNLYLYYSNNLFSSWQSHPKSPVVRNDKSQSRPAGRVTIIDDQYDTGKQTIYRFAQNNAVEYGHSVSVYEVTSLSTTLYDEHLIEPNPLLQGSRYGDSQFYMEWNNNNMHHIDPHQLPDGKYIAAVDGCGIP